MYPNPAISYSLAQARMADLSYLARRENLARAAAHSARPDRPRIPGRLHLRPVRRHRAAAAAS
jgi:hypothetical protein